MADHTCEEERVEPRERAVEASNESPVQGKVQVAGVVDLARLAIYRRVSCRILFSDKKALTPPINQDLMPIRGRKSLGVFHRLPRQLRERVTEHHGSTLLLTETVLLAVGCVPDPVDKQIGGIEKDQEVAVPVVGRGIVVGEVDGAVAVAQRHTSQVPENQHESPFLIVHVPEHVSFGIIQGAR